MRVRSVWTSHPATAVALLTLALLSPSARAQGTATPATRPVADRIPRTTVQLDMVRVPGGRITLKDKDGRETTHEIKPFLIQRTELRWDEWDAFFLSLDNRPDADARTQTRAGREWLDGSSKPTASAYGILPNDDRFGRAGFPMYGASPFTVQKYVQWLNETTGRRYRLPTEAEWTYACRAGSPDPLRPTRAALTRVAWFADNSDDHPHKSATKAPNAWGLYDMLGNVAEWVVPKDESTVVAGGSYLDEAEDVHDAAREVPDLLKWQRDDPMTPKNRRWLSNGTHVGFRLVREIVPGEDK